MVVLQRHTAQVERVAAHVVRPADGGDERRDGLREGELVGDRGAPRIGRETAVTQDHRGGNGAIALVACEEGAACVVGHEAANGVPPGVGSVALALGAHQVAMHLAHPYPVPVFTPSRDGTRLLGLPGTPAHLLLALAGEEVRLRHATQAESQRARVGTVRGLHIAETDGVKESLGTRRVLVRPVGHHAKAHDAASPEGSTEGARDLGQRRHVGHHRPPLHPRPWQTDPQGHRTQRAPDHASRVSDDGKARPHMSSRARDLGPRSSLRRMARGGPEDERVVLPCDGADQGWRELAVHVRSSDGPPGSRLGPWPGTC